MKLILFTLFVTTLFTLADSLPLQFFTWKAPHLSVNEKPVPQPLFLLSQKQITPLLVEQGESLGISKPYKVSLEASFSIYRDKDATNLLASHALLSSKKMILQPLTFPKQRYSILPINVLPEAFPESSILFFNHSPETIHVKVNKMEITIQPNSVDLIPYHLSEKNTLRFFISQKEPPHKKLVVKTVGGREKQRIIGFFHQDHNRNFRLLLNRNLDDQSTQITP